MESISDLSTQELITELMHREGVEVSAIGATGKLTTETTGPAIVLVVVD